MKLLLDTNVLLNGIFNPLSYSLKLLNLCDSHTVECFVLEHNLAEAHDILTRVQQNTGVDLHGSFNAAIKRLPLSVVEPVKDEELQRFVVVGGRKDAPLAAVAVRERIAVCTNDPDFSSGKAKGLGIDVRDPVDAVLAARGYEMDMDIIFPGFLMTPDEGAFYVDALAGWGDFKKETNTTGLWCIFDAEGIGGLYLDLNRGGLAYFVDTGPEGYISLKGFPYGEQRLRVVVSYDSSVGLGIYMGQGKQPFKQASSWTPTSSSNPSKVTFWRGRKGDFGAPTKTRLMAGFAKKVTESGANKLLSGSNPIIPSERLELENLVRQYYL